MIKGLIGVAIGLVTFIVVQQLVAALVTGTSTGDIIIQNILGLEKKLLGLLRVIVVEQRAEVMET